MAHSTTLPALAALALAGGAAGLYLGNSAIAEIDPAHMLPAEEGGRFYADMVPGGAAFDEAPPLRPASLEQGLGDGCVGCITYPEEYVPLRHPAVDGMIGAYAAYDAPTGLEIVSEVDAVLAEDIPPRFAEVERYAHYPVTVEETEAPAQAALREVAAGSAAGAGCTGDTQCVGPPTQGI